VVEAKSGYGLTLRMRSNRWKQYATRRGSWRAKWCQRYWAAHVVPQEYAGKADDYVKLVCNEMIPLVAKKEAGEVRGCLLRSRAFTQEQSEKVLAAAARTAWERAPMSASLRRRS